MDNQRYGIRASGDYATFEGREYFARDMGDRVRLLSDDEPLRPGFQESKKSWIRGERIVDVGSIQQLTKVRTTCTWRGHPFEVGIIMGEIAYVTYLGKDFDQVCRLPGMERPDKFEVIGEVPAPELNDVEEHVEDIDLACRLHSQVNRRHTR
jgi:hypothetical protein